MKCTQSEIENIPILQKSKYILIEPPTQPEPESKIQESSLKIETLSYPTPASTVTFLKGNENTSIENKFYAFRNSNGYIEILKLIGYEYKDDNQVIITFEEEQQQKDYIFKTPFVLQRMYQYEDHKSNQELQEFIKKISVQQGPYSDGIVVELSKLIIGKNLLINDQYVGFVKEIERIRTITNTVTGLFSTKDIYIKAIVLTLTIDNKTMYKITIDLKDLENNQSLLDDTSKKTLKLVQAKTYEQ
jgi:hypothetical protein